jgi:hypothetical protein
LQKVTSLDHLIASTADTSHQALDEWFASIQKSSKTPIEVSLSEIVRGAPLSLQMIAAAISENLERERMRRELWEQLTRNALE